jgi:hypothetical protein
MATPIAQLSTNPKRKRGGPRPGAGRPDKSRLVGSLNEHFRPYTKLYDGTPAFMIAAEAARQIATNYPVIAEVLKRWDRLKKREKMRSRALDKCVEEAGMDVDEFKALVGVALEKECRIRARFGELVAKSEVAKVLPAVVQRSFDSALVPENWQERMSILKAFNILPRGPRRNAKFPAVEQ